MGSAVDRFEARYLPIDTGLDCLIREAAARGSSDDQIKFLFLMSWTEAFLQNRTSTEGLS
jgi:hypothetical protein